MITIEKSSKAEIKEFNAGQWVATDVLTSEKNKGEVFVFKAMEDGEIVGTIYGRLADGVLCIDDLVVTKNKRGLGIGRSLMEKAEAFGRKLKARKAYLITGKDWDVRGFYEKLGYKLTGDFANGSDSNDLVVYENLFED
jgi:GNAT superfamily N-acetyltransferase